MNLARRPGQGYTLIELVVALAVLALASVLMVEALRLGLRTWDTVNTRQSRVLAVATAQQALRGRLQQLYPYRPAQGADLPRPRPLVGHATELSFSAPGPRALSGPMLRFRIYLDHSGAAGALKAAWQPDSGVGSDDPSAAVSEETLLEGVDSATFEYFSPGEHDGGAWMSSWLDKAEAPVLVRLRLRFVDGAAGDWPTFVVRPHLNLAADCEFDLVSRRCR